MYPYYIMTAAGSRSETFKQCLTTFQTLQQCVSSVRALLVFFELVPCPSLPRPLILYGTFANMYCFIFHAFMYVKLYVTHQD